LLERAERELDDDETQVASERVRADLAPLVGEDDAARFELARFEVDWHGVGPKTIQGLALIESEVLVTELLDQLVALDDECLARVFGPMRLGTAELRAALHAAYFIMNALEWESRDRHIPAHYTPEQRDRMLAATQRSLQSFRTTGEP
jgi:hypothetical protein